MIAFATFHSRNQTIADIGPLNGAIRIHRQRSIHFISSSEHTCCVRADQTRQVRDATECEFCPLAKLWNCEANILIVGQDCKATLLRDPKCTHALTVRIATNHQEIRATAARFRRKIAEGTSLGFAFKLSLDVRVSFDRK